MDYNKLFQFSQEEKSYFVSVGVSAIVLFGSRATKTARENSDFDIGILTSDTALLPGGTKHTEVYDRLYEIFSRSIKQLVNIDIVFLQVAPGELKAHVVKHGVVLFEAKPGVFAVFVEREMQRYADFAPLRRIFHSSILSRIP